MCNLFWTNEGNGGSYLLEKNCDHIAFLIKIAIENKLGPHSAGAL